MAEPTDEQDYFGGLGQTLLGQRSIPTVIGAGLGATLLGNAVTPSQAPANTGSWVQGLMSGLPAQPAGTSRGSPPWTPAPTASADEAPVAAATGQGGLGGNAASPGTAAPPFDVDKAIDYLDKNATSKYIPGMNGHCAWAVRQAIAAGGGQVANIQDAKDYGPSLVKAGFNQLDAQGLKNYTPQKGDVIIYPAWQKHTSGHMEMYDGTHWVSDFMQKGPVPFGDGTLPYEIYRP